MEGGNFFQENVWASFVVLFVIIVLFGVVMYVKTKKTFERLVKVTPELDIYTRVFGKTMGKIMPLILLVLSILFSWLLIKRYQ